VQDIGKNYGKWYYVFIMIKEKQINQITAKIIENHNPERIFLFGSLAWGKPRNDSDIDLLVVKKNIKSMRQAAEDIDRTLFDRQVALDILVYSPEYFKKRLDLGDSFAKKIFDKGKLLYAKK